MFLRLFVRDSWCKHLGLTVARRTICVLLAALLLTSCGFHLRSWQLQGNYDAVELSSAGQHSVARALRSALRQTGVPLITAATRAEFADAKVLVVELLDSTEDLRTASVSGSARTAEYELSLRLRYAVRRGAGDYLAKPTWARAARVYRLDRGNLVGSNEEQALLRRELQADLVQQVMRVLNTVSREGAS
jgi:LPS-assembly lipoprotein